MWNTSEVLVDLRVTAWTRARATKDKRKNLQNSNAALIMIESIVPFSSWCLLFPLFPLYRLLLFRVVGIRSPTELHRRVADAIATRQTFGSKGLPVAVLCAVEASFIALMRQYRCDLKNVVVATRKHGWPRQQSTDPLVILCPLKSRCRQVRVMCRLHTAVAPAHRAPCAVAHDCVDCQSDDNLNKFNIWLQCPKVGCTVAARGNSMQQTAEVHISGNKECSLGSADNLEGRIDFGKFRAPGTDPQGG